jgi:hypothetical protein
MEFSQPFRLAWERLFLPLKTALSEANELGDPEDNTLVWNSVFSGKEKTLSHTGKV